MISIKAQQINNTHKHLWDKNSMILVVGIKSCTQRTVQQVGFHIYTPDKRFYPVK